MWADFLVFNFPRIFKAMNESSPMHLQRRLTFWKRISILLFEREIRAPSVLRDKQNMSLNNLGSFSFQVPHWIWFPGTFGHYEFWSRSDIAMPFLLPSKCEEKKLRKMEANTAHFLGHAHLEGSFVSNVCVLACQVHWIWITGYGFLSHTKTRKGQATQVSPYKDELSIMFTPT